MFADLVQLWLTQYDRGELDREEVEASVLADYEATIAALERKVGQLAMELDLLKRTARLRLVSANESSSVISGPDLRYRLIPARFSHLSMCAAGMRVKDPAGSRDSALPQKPMLPEQCESFERR